MNYFLFWFLVGVIVGVVIALVYWWVCHTGEKQRKSLHGVSVMNHNKDAKRDGYLQRILALFKKHEELTNIIIQKELGFDDRTIVRYMDELEKQEKVEQVGKVGWPVKYRLKK